MYVYMYKDCEFQAVLGIRRLMEAKKPRRSSSEMNPEIWVVPFFGQGHLLPMMELCKQIASRNFNTTLIISSNLSSSIPPFLRQHPLLQIAELPPLSSPPQQQPPGSDGPHHHHHKHHAQMAQGLEDLMTTRSRSPDSRLPICVVVDIMMGWMGDIFKEFGIPSIGFFTSGACSGAMEYAMWKADLEDLKPGETRLLPGLPEEMALTDSDLKRRPHGPPGGRGAGFPGPPPGALGPRKMRPPNPGERPPWLDEPGGSIASMINTCDDLERPFLEYLTRQVGKPVWGVGPLLPEQYWKSAGSLLHDGEIRSNRRSSVTEDEVIAWLDSKPRGSVLYVSFGSEVSPKMEEYPHLADALKATKRPFIWVLQPGTGRPGPPRQFSDGSPNADEEGYYPEGLGERVGERGLIIRGWAPQLLILSHPSTGGFLSHCGWNSTVEAIGRGVPFLAWPIRGDQYYNAQLVVKHLKVGCMVSDDLSQMIKKDDIMKGIESLLGDGEIKKRAKLLRDKFEQGFPPSSAASLDAFKDFIVHQKSGL